MTNKRPIFLAPEALDAAAETLLQLAKQARVPIAFCGGYVMQLFGSPRLTGDIDIVAAAPFNPMLDRGDSLTFGGYKSTVMDVPVDVIVRSDEWRDLYEEALLHFDVHEHLPIIRPEYLATMKMVAARGKDNDDIVFLLATGAVDVTAFRVVVREHLGAYALRDLEEFVREAAWRTDKGEFSR